MPIRNHCRNTNCPFFCPQKDRVSLNSFQAGGREQQPSPSQLAQSPAPEPGTAPGGFLQQGAHPQLQGLRAALRHSQACPHRCSQATHSSGDTRAWTQSCEADAKVARLTLLSLRRPSPAPPQIPGEQSCSAETHTGFSHLPSSPSHQLWLERQGLHYRTL